MMSVDVDHRVAVPSRPAKAPAATSLAAEPALPCRRHDSELWFAESPDDVERAKELCRGCPLRHECLKGALERAEPWGVWGGELLVQGLVVARKRPRGRPRKKQSCPVRWCGSWS